MDTNRLKRFATEARNILMQGVVHRLSALGFLPDGSVTEEPQQQGGGATFMGDTVTQDFYDKWQSLYHAVTERSIAEVAEEAAFTWFNRLVAIRILVKNGLASPVLEYESEDVLVPLLVSEARQGRMPKMNANSMHKLTNLLEDDSKTNEQFALLIVAYCHENPIINSCFGAMADYTELLLPNNILTEGGFVDMLNHTDFITDADYRSPELIGWLYQFYISERKDEVFAKKGKFEADEIPAATQIFTPNWIVKYMVQNTVGRIYLDNNPYETQLQKKWKYLVEPSEKPSADSILKYEELTDLRVADLACGSGHILNECFDLLYDLYIAEGYGRGEAIENIFRHNLTGVDLDTRAKQLATFALLLKACQKDNAFADAHCLPNVLDMTGVVPKMNEQELSDACLRFIGGYEDVAGEMLEQDFELLRDAENLGSIMKFNDDEDYLAMLRYHYEDWTEGGIEDCPEEIKALIPGVRLILALTDKYHALVMNPPYMGSGNMNSTLSKYVKSNYEEGKADLFSVFMLLTIDRLLPNGKYGMINMQSWMFLSSFEKLRTRLLTENRIDNMLHLGPRTFDELSGEVVQNTAFVISNCEGKDATGSYYRLIEGKNCGDKERMFLEAKENEGKAIVNSKFYIVNYNNVSQQDFEKIPGCPIGYWVSEKMLNAMTGIKISEYGISDGQNITGDNNKYLRLLWEVDYTKAGKGNKWVPMAKGGSFRRWYGNIDTVVNWSSTARNEYKQNPVARIQDEYLWYRTGITWNLICSGNGTGFRLLTSDTLFNKAAPTIVVKKEYENMANYILAYLNTYVTRNILKIMNPTFNTNIAEVFNLAIKIQGQERVTELADQNISISKQDWDAHETSWDFEENPLLAVDEETYIDNINHEIERHEKETGEHLCINPAMPELDSLEWRMEQYKQKWEHLFMQLHENEEELNRQFIDIYGLQDELTPDVPLDEITILQQGEVSIE